MVAVNPVATAQSILTRLKLLQGEWFINTQAGTPYATQILGKGTKPTYDQAIKTVILGTNGVSSLVSYSSQIISPRSAITKANLLYISITFRIWTTNAGIRSIARGYISSSWTAIRISATGPINTIGWRRI